MEPKFKNDIFEQDISIEEFDHITDGVEDHVFSDRYQSRKETIMNNAKHKAKISKLGVKVVAAASVRRSRQLRKMRSGDLGRSIRTERRRKACRGTAFLSGDS